MPFWPASGSLEAFDFVGVVGANNNNNLRRTYRL